MRHAVQRDRERHAGLQQVRKLLREGCHLLELRFALLRECGAEGRRQERFPIGFLPGRPLRCGYRTRLGAIDCDREKPQSLDLHEGGRTIGDLEETFHDFATSPACFVRELRHKNSLPSLNNQFRGKLQLSKRVFVCAGKFENKKRSFFSADSIMLSPVNGNSGFKTDSSRMACGKAQGPRRGQSFRIRRVYDRYLLPACVRRQTS